MSLGGGEGEERGKVFLGRRKKGGGEDLFPRESEGEG